MKHTNKIPKSNVLTKEDFETALKNNIPDTLKEIEEEILLQKKKNKLFKLQLKSRYIVDKDSSIIRKQYVKKKKYPPFPPPTSTRDTNYYNNLLERKKHLYNLEDVLMIVFLSIFGSVMITLIIIGI